MDSVQILGEGSFQQWPADVFRELARGASNEDVGQHIVFEDTRTRVWSINLEPGQRLPFHCHRKDYSWSCLTAGLGLTRYDTGEVFRVTYQRGDQAFYDHQVKGDFVHDLENIGSETLSFITVEFLR